MHRGHRIEISVVDHTGTAVDPAPAIGKGRRTNGPFLEVRALADGQASRFELFSSFLVGDVVVYPARPDQEYLITWQQPGIPYQEVRARVDWHRFRIPVRIKLGRPAEDAALTLRILDPLGEEFEGPIIHIRSPESGREIMTTLGSVEQGILALNAPKPQTDALAV